MNVRFLIATVLVAVSLTGCLQTLPQYRAHYRFVESPQTYSPKKVVLLPVQMTIKEVTAGGVSEEVPTWSKQGSANVREALASYFRSEKQKRVQLVDMPKLSDQESENVRQHIALYREVASSAVDKTYGQQNAAMWRHKIQKFDYTLGSGLKSLAQRTGADSAVIVVGEDTVSTTGRKIAAFLMDSVSYGHSFLSVGIVNLNTGDIIWFNYAFEYKSMDLREAKDAQAMVARVFDEYPGIERYKNLKLVQQ